MTDGALLINKHEGISSFDVIRILKEELIKHNNVKKRDLPKLGHCGTLDPFATGLLAVCVGKAVKLAQYFLGAFKSYEGVILFGKTTIPGDPTAPISETKEQLPESLQELQTMALKWTKQAYMQTPPMHSAKKINGQKLYELARKGIEIERQPKLCQLYRFEITEYDKPKAKFILTCSSGTYIRTLAQDFARFFDTVGMLESLTRTAIGYFELKNAYTTQHIRNAMSEVKSFKDFSCFMPFDEILKNYDQAEVSADEVKEIAQGNQKILFQILKRVIKPKEISNSFSPPENLIALFHQTKLIAVVRQQDYKWLIEKVFV
ncbi:tRNA pseudouridine(55) synthase TruB [Candidatus Nomurabacteria bacterium]|nr:tRNA pseudouridine(55) synthase TruB [Candidatus Nomurabacteria bacterium]